MKNLLYIGNRLKSENRNQSYIHVLGNLLSKEGYSLSYASSHNNKVLRLLDMMFKVFKLRHKVDLVLIDTYSTQNFYYAYCVSQLCRIFKLDYIPILHGGNLPSRLESHSKMSAKIFKNALCNVSPSKYLKNAFEAIGYENIVHIPNAFEIENYQLTDKEFEEPNLLWVRSFSKIYNPKLAIEVFQLLKQTYPKSQLCMVGPDSDGTLKDIKVMVQNLNLDVKFTGKLSKQEWVALSKTYNIFINTTNFDNMPLSVIEAMALGIPVVSTNVGGMPYLIKNNDNGILVTPNNAKDMAEAVKHLIENEQSRQKIIKSARAKVEQFDWKHIKHLWFRTLE